MVKSFHTKSYQFIDYTEMDDKLNDLVYRARNDIRIRQWMTNPDVITKESHNKFVASLVNNCNTVYYAVIGEGFLGSVNIRKENQNRAERGIYLNPDFLGKGLALHILKEFYQYIWTNLGLQQITTKVLKDNVPSISLEERLGAKLIGENERFYFYLLNLD